MTASPEFKELLVTRLRHRTSGGANYYELDLRHKKFNQHGVVVVRDPNHPQWPDEGATTNDKPLAERWVRDHYADYFRTEFELQALYPDVARMTFEVACERYLAALAQEKGDDHNTYINRYSEIHTHVIPRFGSTRMAAMGRPAVWQWLNELQVSKPDGEGGLKCTPAAYGTKRAVRATLTAIWKEVAPHQPCPYQGVRIKGGIDIRAWRKQLAEGNLDELLKPKSGALRPADAMRLFAAAAYYDRKLASAANTRAYCVANTLLLLIVGIATGMRIAELRLLRWSHIKEDEGYIYILGTKTQAALRVVPLQQRLLPWLNVLRELARPAGAPKGWKPDPNAPVFFTTRKRPNEAASKRTLQQRVNEVLLLAGLKTPGKATHWMRATFAMWASRERKLIAKEDLKAFLGHANRWGGETDTYIDDLIEMMQPEHRHIIRHLPTPKQVEKALTTFTPVAMPHWKDRRSRWSPRKKKTTAKA